MQSHMTFCFLTSACTGPQNNSTVSPTNAVINTTVERFSFLILVPILYIIKTYLLLLVKQTIL
jgi:hypothetical protein